GNEPETVLGDRGLEAGPELPVSLFIDGGTVQADDFPQRALAFDPQGLREAASPTAQVEPAFAGLRVQPGHGGRQETAIGRQLSLAPKGLGTSRFMPVIVRGQGRWHGWLIRETQERRTLFRARVSCLLLAKKTTAFL